MIEIDTRPPIEQDEAIDILYDLVLMYDGHYTKDSVKQSMRKSIPYKKLVEFINRHYTDNDDIERD